ncbi:MAG: hypothetical protein RIE77_02185 [Phycisphaerales bacterium]|jgi:hypothetical protein
MNCPTPAILAITVASACTAPTLAQAILIEADLPGGLPMPGDRTTITMSAGFNPLDYAMAAIGTDLVINQVQGRLEDPRLIAPMNGPGTSAGAVSGTGVDGIIAGQLNFPLAGIYADPTNPIAFWAVDWIYEPGGPGPGSDVLLHVVTETTRFDVYTDRLLATSEFRVDELEEGELLIVVPAPSSAVALVGGLALASRRRR